ncbi:hypothetical protein EPF86_24435, partial [Salmonella enterica]|nr:hypothetical protein [Salmonella enterica]MEM22692.1 hypothetical protein [Salmonella enterica]
LRFFMQMPTLGLLLKEFYAWYFKLTKRENIRRTICAINGQVFNMLYAVKFVAHNGEIYVTSTPDRSM